MLMRAVALLASLSLIMLGLAFMSPSVSADDIGMDTASSESVVPGSSPGEDSAGIGASTDAQGHGQVNEGGGTPPGVGESTSPPTDTPPTDTPPTGEGSAVLVCLATTDPAAPYTSTMVMPTAIINGEGRVKKEGPANSPIGVAPAAVWGNIVAPVTHPSGASFAGLNWGPDGRAIWDQGCGFAGPGVPPDEGHDDGEHGDHATVVVCIATPDSVTPYDVEEWMVQKIINGHGMPQKNGPAVNPVEGVYPVDVVWGNIIPVFTHPNGKATYDGLNLADGGQAILDAGCAYVVPTEPALTPESAPAALDFCPDLDGVQWENYDCNTPQAVAAEVTVPAEPAIVVTAEPAAAVVPELVPTPISAAMPAQVPVPTAQTVPAAVDAGGGSSDPAAGLTWVACLFILSCLGAAGSAARLVSSGASLR